MRQSRDEFAPSAYNICRYCWRMPLPIPPHSNGLGGIFGSLGVAIGPVMMLLIALKKPGPVRTLIKANADAPTRARKAKTLGLEEPPLAPLIRAGVVVRDADGCIWLDRARLRRRQWRLGILVCGASFALVALLYVLLRL